MDSNHTFFLIPPDFFFFNEMTGSSEDRLIAKLMGAGLKKHICAKHIWSVNANIDLVRRQMSLKHGGGDDDKIRGRSWSEKLHLRRGWGKEGEGRAMGSDGSIEDGGEESGKGRKEQLVQLLGEGFESNNLETPRDGFGSSAGEVGIGPGTAY